MVDDYLVSAIRIGKWRSRQKIIHVKTSDIFVVEDIHFTGQVSLEKPIKERSVILHDDGEKYVLIAGIGHLVRAKLENKETIKAMFTNCKTREQFDNMLRIEPMPDDIIHIDKIIIPKSFIESRISPKKVLNAFKRYYTENHRPIILDANNVLVDNYSDYIIHQNEGLEYISFRRRS